MHNSKGHASPGALRIAVVGGGFSGAVFGLQLARKATVPVAIDIVEPRPLLGGGLAYSTNDPSHRINVPASKMSVFAEQPAHFDEWLRRSDTPAIEGGAIWSDGQVYPQRGVFGRYVASLVEDANRTETAHIRHLRDTAMSARRYNGGYRLRLAGDAECVADMLVIATGHPAPARPPLLVAALGDDPAVISDPWADGALNHIPKQAAVLIIGTALTMADVVASLHRSGHTGAITAFSRRGLLSSGHVAVPAPYGYFNRSPPQYTALGLWRSVRRAISVAVQAGVPWQAVIDDVRSNGTAIWEALSVSERRRFLRHCRTYWDVHRYRVAPQVEAILEQKRADGSLEALSASLLQVRRNKCRIEVLLRLRRCAGAGEILRVVDAIVVATGPAQSGVIDRSPLLLSLSRQSLIRPDPNGLGLDVDHGSRAIGVDGEGNSTLLVAGPLARGRFGELMGLPQVSEHAAMLAEKVAAWAAERHAI